MVETQVDITFAISMVSHFTQNLKLDHFNTIDQILRYLANGQNKNFIFKKKPIFYLFGYLYSD